MPDKEGKLSSEEKDQAIKLISARGSPAPVCSVCHTNSWQLGDHLVQPISQGAGGALYFGGVGYPQVMLVCKKCSHTLFFNAVGLGLLPAEKKP